jgi:hypothetical protein
MNRVWPLDAGDFSAVNGMRDWQCRNQVSVHETWFLPLGNPGLNNNRPFCLSRALAARDRSLTGGGDVRGSGVPADFLGAIHLFAVFRVDG